MRRKNLLPFTKNVLKYSFPNYTASSYTAKWGSFRKLICCHLLHRESNGEHILHKTFNTQHLTISTSLYVLNNAFRERGLRSVEQIF